MFLRNPVLSEARTLPAIGSPDDTLEMDQDTFRALYQQTAKPVWLFLCKRVGSEHLADDLLQETYYRFLRTRRDYESAAHRKNYLFRIAANVANDALRRRSEPLSSSPADPDGVAARGSDAALGAQRRTDLERAMRTLNARQRSALWLAYAEGATHDEIAGILGMRKSSVKPLLFRARKKVAAVLRGGNARNHGSGSAGGSEGTGGQG